MIKRDCPLSLCLYFVAVLCPVSLFFYLVRICSVRVRLPPFHLPSFPRVKNTNEGHPRVLTHFYSSLHSTGLPGGQPGVNAAKTKSLFLSKMYVWLKDRSKLSFSVGYFKIPKNSRGISSASVHHQPFHEIPSLEFQYAFQVRHGREHVATTLQDSSSDCCFVTAMGLETGMEVGGVSVSVFLSEQRKKRAKEGSLSLLQFTLHIYVCVLMV